MNVGSLQNCEGMERHASSARSMHSDAAQSLAEPSTKDTNLETDLDPGASCSNEPAPSVDSLASLPSSSTISLCPTSGVSEPSAHHFFVMPGLRNTEVCMWINSLPALEGPNIMMAYLQYEHARLRTRIGRISAQYEKLRDSKLVLTTEWTAKVKMNHESAAAACLHKVAWDENYNWFLDSELSLQVNDTTDWVYLDLALVCFLEDMLAAMQRVQERTRQVDPASIERTTAAVTHARLRELRGNSKDSSDNERSDARLRYRDKLLQRVAARERGLSTSASVASPLRQERGKGPVYSDAKRGSSTPVAAARMQYTFECASEADNVDMSLVVEQLVLAQDKPSIA